MWASLSGNTETVSVLLAAIADPNITDEVKLHYSHCLYNQGFIQWGGGGGGGGRETGGSFPSKLPSFPP